MLLRARPLLAGLLLALATSACPAEEPAFEFDGQDFFLRGDEAGIREYLTKGETFDKWTKLISIRHFDGINDPALYAQKLLENAKASGPNARGQILANEEAGSYIADFLLFSEEGSEPFFAEWNLWRIEKKGDGLEAVQYARRFYKVDGSTSQKLIDARQKVVPQLAILKIPQ